ncbi:MAG: DUF3460 family protein [Variovorax sp.]|jgi:hypothetical protein|nr:MAG: DUF3460 family protein [Variovorax sp.]
MSIFNRPHYTSEITQFIDELKQKRPHLEADQRTGRALLWDKQPVDLGILKDDLDAKVPQQPYVYQTQAK